MIRSMTRSSVRNKQDYRSMLAGNEAFSPGAYELISTTILGANTTSVTFSSIDTTTYKHLQVRAAVRSTRVNDSDNAFMRVNGDTGANYAWHKLYGNGTSALSTAITSTGSYRFTIDAANDAANIFSPAVIDILDYANTNKYKTIRGASGKRGSTTVYDVALTSGVWMSTTAVTSLEFVVQSGQYATGSRFSLYGIKG